MAEYQLTINQSFLALLSFIPFKAEKIVMTKMHTTADLLNDKLVDMAFITAFSGLSDKWFYKLIQDGLFPKPIKMGRSSRWLRSEVEAWILQRIADSRGV